MIIKQPKKSGEKMIGFISGLLIGATVGILIIALLSANKDD